MRAHHEESLRHLVESMRVQDGTLAVILCGSLAKGTEREDSDIDALIVLDDIRYLEREAAHRLAETITDGCTYPGGYFDLKYVDKGYLEAAAREGSEPTRSSFLGARCLFAVDAGIEDLVASIPVYQKGLQKEKLLSFVSAFLLNAYYFWGEALRRNDPYLRTRTSADLVLFGMRMILAKNEMLFPCQKWLMRTVAAAPIKPEGIVSLADAFLLDPSDANKETFVNTMLYGADWGLADIPQDFFGTRFIEDSEWWWWKNRPNIAEW